MSEMNKGTKMPHSGSVDCIEWLGDLVENNACAMVLAGNWITEEGQDVA